MQAMAWPRAVNDRSGFVCKSCGTDAKHNQVLRISFCPIHGLNSRLDVLPGRAEGLVSRVSIPAPVTAGRRALLAVPA